MFHCIKKYYDGIRHRHELAQGKDFPSWEYRHLGELTEQLAPYISSIDQRHYLEEVILRDVSNQIAGIDKEFIQYSIDRNAPRFERFTD